MAETLGSFLRKKRESLGLTLEKVEGSTHIRVRHLQAIESDDLSSIPSVPQARGFIRNYASFLGVSPDELAERIGGTRPRPLRRPAEGRSVPAAGKEAAQQAPAPLDQSAPPAGAGTRPRASITAPVVSRSAPEAATRPLPVSRMRSWFRLDMILGGAVTLVIVALLSWGAYHIVLSMQGPAAVASTESFLPLGPEAAATTEPASDLTPAETTGGTAPETTGTEFPETDGMTPDTTGAASAATPATVAIATPLPTAFPTPLGGIYTDVRIHLIIVLRAYLEVEVDGQMVFSGRVLPEETYDFIGQKTVAVSTGNGAGIRVIFNGVDEGTMGRFGEVVSQTYTPTGIITPIPTATVTPTVTDTPALGPTP